jgi:CBS domain-containing protein
MERRMTLVRDLMKGPVVTADVECRVSAVARLLRDHKTRDVVITEGGRPVGIVTDRDLVVRVLAVHLSPDAAVGDICSTDLVSVGPEDGLEWVETLMSRHGLSRLPVFHDEHIVGFVSRTDIVASELDLASEPKPEFESQARAMNVQMLRTI